jgi:peptide/nickel transport system substrate-binding protein
MKRKSFSLGFMVFLALILASLLLVVSCSSTPSSTSTAPPAVSTTTPKQASTTAPVVSTTTKTPTPSVTPRSGGILKIILCASPGSPIGWPIEGKGSIPQYTVSPALEGLIDRDFTGAISPWLATGWQVAADKKSIQLTLRKGVKFQDGSDWNATSCKWNLDAYLTAKNIVTVTWSSIDIVDDYTVRINLKYFENTMPSDLASIRIVSQQSFETKGIDWVRWNAVGTGPFSMVSFEKDVKAVFKKFENYWQKGKPYLDGVEINFVVDAMTQQLAFEADTANVLALASGRQAADLSSKGYTVVSAGNGGVRSLLFDSANASSPFSNLKVRQAVCYAIDREAIAKALGRGFWKPMTQICFPGTQAYLPELDTQYKYDPAKAKQLLAEAGYASGFITKITPTADPEGLDSMVSVQRYLGDIGIKVNIETVDYAKFNSIRYSEGGWQNSMLMDMITPTAGGSFASFMRMYYQDANPANYISTKRPAGFKETIAEALTTTDFQTEKSLCQKLHKIITDEVMYCPLYGVGFQFPIKNVHDADFLYTGFYPGWHPANAWLDK